MSFKVGKADDQYTFGLCIYIRTLVYVIEQNVTPIPNEFNEHDNDVENFVGWFDGAPVATARYRLKDKTTGKIERIAVLEEHRGKGFGKAIVEHLMQEMIKEHPEIEKIIMFAQDAALPFYEKMGYAAIGEGFIQAGIPHHKIEMSLEKN